MSHPVRVQFGSVVATRIGLQGYEAAKDAYATMLRIPHGTELRIEAQAALSRLRDFIAVMEGRSAQEVQEEYESRALEASKRHVKKKQAEEKRRRTSYVIDLSKPPIQYYCEFCGIYKSLTGPRCNKCETD